MFIAEERERTLAIACALALLLGGSAVSRAQAVRPLPTDNPKITKADKAVGEAVSKFFSNSCHVGLSIAMVKGGQTTFYNAGSTFRDKQELANPDNVYEIASVTKTFTGALAADAVVDHRMQLDANFGEYLPQSYPNLAWQGHPITLRTLATHRSGLPRDLPNTDDLYANRNFNTFPDQLIARETGYDEARYLRELHSVHLNSLPGSDEVYSNLGTRVIGFGLEKVYGMPYETLIEQKILRPLGMTSTGFVIDTAEQSRLVRGYDRNGKLMPYHLRNAGAAYGLYATPRDMAKYLRWQLDEANPAIKLAHQPLLGKVEDGEGLIWHLAIDRGTRILWHGGGTFGMSSQMVLYPDAQEGFVLLANDTCQGTEGALKDIAMEVHQALDAASK